MHVLCGVGFKRVSLWSKSSHITYAKVHEDVGLHILFTLYVFCDLVIGTRGGNFYKYNYMR